MWQQSETLGFCQCVTADVWHLPQNYLCVFHCYWIKVCAYVHVVSYIPPDYEIQRQTSVLQRGGTVQNETRAYDSKLG